MHSGQTSAILLLSSTEPSVPFEQNGLGSGTRVPLHGLALSQNWKYALGRETKYTPPMRDVGSDDDSDSDSDGEEPLNPLESTPMLITAFPEGIVITNIAADDSISIAVTDTGKVYGWGTFRCSGGVLGFDEKTRIQSVPVLLPTLKNIVQVGVGTDHVLGLTREEMYTRGAMVSNPSSGDVSSRTRLNGLIPREFGLPQHQVKYAATDGRVWVWGLNQYGQCGIYNPQHAGEDNTVIPVPTVVESLTKYNIVQTSAGEHHSVAATEDGELLVWGRLDGGQLGLDPETLPAKEVIRDVSGKPRYLSTPRAVPGIEFSFIGCGTHHHVAISREGQAYSWGYGGSHQTATRGVKMVFSDAGGQFPILAGIPPRPTNGTL
ncbi:RCC1/BLIP-II [Choiromyces venosus 120613-1]|uniref:RCC1/BLIP-II n=1 Tax=Choiromyces venosus 120613-1 TaxID=1336337 RepID=A0A3N4JL17_9PEZI|nr:RCC1/BLIP-II [Choiromyces venosus 120613-1]